MKDRHWRVSSVYPTSHPVSAGKGSSSHVILKTINKTQKKELVLRRDYLTWRHIYPEKSIFVLQLQKDSSVTKKLPEMYRVEVFEYLEVFFSLTISVWPSTCRSADMHRIDTGDCVNQEHKRSQIDLHVCLHHAYLIAHRLFSALLRVTVEGHSLLWM